MAKRKVSGAMRNGVHRAIMQASPRPDGLGNGAVAEMQRYHAALRREFRGDLSVEEMPSDISPDANPRQESNARRP